VTNAVCVVSLTNALSSFFLTLFPLGISASKCNFAWRQDPSLRAHLPHYPYPTICDIRIYQILKSVISIHEAYEVIYDVFKYVKDFFKHHKDSPPSHAARTRHSPVTTVPSPTDTVSHSSIVEAVVYATVAEQFKRTGKPLSDQFFDVAFGNGDHADWSKWCGPIIHSLYNLCTNPAGAEIVGAVSLTNAPSSSSSNAVFSRYLRM